MNQVRSLEDDLRAAEREAESAGVERAAAIRRDVSARQRLATVQRALDTALSSSPSVTVPIPSIDKVMADAMLWAMDQEDRSKVFDKIRKLGGNPGPCPECGKPRHGECPCR
jgi:hypothetical protein